jgi:hypothetical protein
MAVYDSFGAELLGLDFFTFSCDALKFSSRTLHRYVNCYNICQHIRTVFMLSCLASALGML